MEKMKKLLCFVMAIAMLATLFAGCNQNAADPTEGPAGMEAPANTDAASEAPEVPAEPIEISIASWSLDITDVPEDDLYKSVLDKFNITIDRWSTGWDNYYEKIQTWCATGQIPDLFSIDAFGQPYYTTWVEEGIIRQIPDDLSAYPNLKAIMDMADTAAYKDPDGHYYCIPKPNYADNVLWGLEKGIYVRKDWMEACGYTEQPKSMDEFIAMVKDIMAQNPEGSSNLVGVTAQNKSHFFSFMLSYAPEVACSNNYWIKGDDGSWVPGILTDRTKTGLEEMNKLYTEGVMDTDIPIIKDSEGIDKFVSGKAVALCAAPNLIASIKDSFSAVYPDKNWEDCFVLIQPWAGPNGNAYRYATLSHWAETYIGGDVTDEEMHTILAFYDYMLGEGLTACRFGEEGVDYKMNGDEVEITIATKEDGTPYKVSELHKPLTTLKSVFTWDGDFALVNPAVDPAVRKFQLDYAAWLRENTEPVETNFQLTYMIYENKDKTVADPTDDMLKVVMSDDFETAYAAMIADMKALGYDIAIASFNEAAKAAGIE